MKMKRLLSLFVLLVAIVTGAQAYYKPTGDEVIILDYIRDVYGANTGYSTHSAISWAGEVSASSSKKCGDPYNDGALTSSSVTCYSAKGNGGGKNITVSVTGVSKIIVYHDKNSSRHLELRSGSKTGTLIGEGEVDTPYTEVELSPSTEYNIFLHGTDGSLDQDLYVYAIKLITPPAYNVQGNNVEYLLTESNYNADDFFTQSDEIPDSRWTSNKGEGDYLNGEKYYNMSSTKHYIKLNVKGARDFKFVVENGTAGRHYAVQVNDEEPIIVEHPGSRIIGYDNANIWSSLAESQIFVTPSTSEIVTIKIG